MSYKKYKFYFMCLFCLFISSANYSQPLSGEWVIPADFGEFKLEVNNDGSYITKVTTTFSSFACGGVTQNGTMSSQSSPGWQILNSQFDIQISIDPFGNIKMTYTGTFTEAGNEASGEWSCNVNGSVCSGDWGPIISDVENILKIPHEFVLYQNYPNPFNPNTIIGYSINVETFIRLNVFDVLGKEVKILINEKQKAGNYKIEFDGSELTSGIYFYKLQTGDASTLRQAQYGGGSAHGFVETKKMILLK